MDFIRGAGRWLLALLIGVMVTAWIGAFVMQQTLLNRDTVKSWVAASGAYDNFAKSFFNVKTDQGVATNTDVQNAFTATFTPSYVKQQAEGAIDATYDWIDGKTKTVSFSIPIQQKRQEFVNNLVAQVEPRLAALPQCPTRVSPDTANPTCIPRGMTAHDLAAQVTQLADGTDFLNQPLTQDNLAQNGQQLPNMDYLPKYASFIRTLTAVLPITILVCIGAYILLCADKLHGWTVISRRLVFQNILIAILGGVLWYMGGTIDISAAAQSDPQQLATVKNVVNPILQHVLPDIGKALSLSAGVLVLLAGASWAAAFVVRRKFTRVTPFSAAAKPAPAAPAQQATVAPNALPNPSTSQPKPTKPTTPPKISL